MELMVTTTKEKIALEKKAFAKRFNLVIDKDGEAPEKFSGRQAYIGKKFGVGQKGARKWLEGESFPEYARMCIIARAYNYLGITAEWLFFGNPKYKPEWFLPDIVTERLLHTSQYETDDRVGLYGSQDDLDEFLNHVQPVKKKTVTIDELSFIIGEKIADYKEISKLDELLLLVKNNYNTKKINDHDLESIKIIIERLSDRYNAEKPGTKPINHK